MLRRSEDLVIRRPSARTLRAALGALIVLCALGCGGGTTEPFPFGRLAFVRTVEGDPISLIDVETGLVLRRPDSGLGLLGEDAAAYPPAGSQVVFSGGGYLVGFDLQSASIAWREAIGTSSAARFDGQSVYGNFALAFTSDGQQLLVADADSGGVRGIAVLDAMTRDAVGFVGPLLVRTLITRPPTAGATNPGLVALGARFDAGAATDYARLRGKLYLIAGSPLAVTDSIAFLSTADSAAGGVVAMALASDGRSLIFITYLGNLYKYDLVDRQYVASLTLPTFGSLAISERTGSVFVIDRNSNRDYPGTGMMYVVDKDLSSATPIDLSAAAYDRVAPRLNAIATDPESDLVYVGAGTGAYGPLFGVQRGKIIVVDVNQRRVARVINLHSWGVAGIRFR